MGKLLCEKKLRDIWSVPAEIGQILHTHTAKLVVEIYPSPSIRGELTLSLSHLRADHRISRTTKLWLYRVCVCSSLMHCCEAWTLNRPVTRSINGFNSRCLHVMTGEHYRETATAPAYDLVLVLAVGRHRLRYIGHVLLMPDDRMVRYALMALVSDYIQYPTGSLFSDCHGVALTQLVAMASNRLMWRVKVTPLS